MTIDALLFTTPACPHCPGVKTALQGLQQEGLIQALEVVDLSIAPERGAEYGVRSVPWLKLGEFVLHGVQTPAELRHWAEQAAYPDGISGYLKEQLANGELDAVEALLQRQPQHLASLLGLLKKEERPIQVALGVSAILESLPGQTLAGLEPELLALADETDHRLRADAAHFLGLLDSATAKHKLMALRDDPHPEVREIAADALE